MEYTRFALTSDECLIEAKKGLNLFDTLHCIGCGQLVRLYASHTHGPRAQKAHFRHIFNTESHSCFPTSESYVHNFAKHRFYKLYRDSNSFTVSIRFTRTCMQTRYPECQKSFEETINLKDRFPEIVLEKRDGDFIPDCMITNSEGEKVYIEILYSNPTSKEKILSGIPIIEIQVSSEKNVIDTITSKGLIATEQSITTYNFHHIITDGEYDCGGNCSMKAFVQHSHLYSHHPAESIKLIQKHLSCPEAFAKKRLDYILDLYRTATKSEVHSPSRYGWYRFLGKNGKLYYRKDQNLYLFMYNNDYYGVYHFFGEFYIFTTVSNGIKFFGTVATIEGAPDFLDKILPQDTKEKDENNSIKQRSLFD